MMPWQNQGLRPSGTEDLLTFIPDLLGKGHKIKFSKKARGIRYLNCLSELPTASIYQEQVGQISSLLPPGDSP
jgi:hypothetical protein